LDCTECDFFIVKYMIKPCFLNLVIISCLIL